jgi:hypothetical protein
MEMSQGNSLYIFLKKPKMLFCFVQNGEQKGRAGSAWRIGTSGIGEKVEIVFRRVNIMPIFCTHVCT